jgi:hypothetical protein
MDNRRMSRTISSKTAIFLCPAHSMTWSIAARQRSVPIAISAASAWSRSSAMCCRPHSRAAARSLRPAWTRRSALRHAGGRAGQRSRRREIEALVAPAQMTGREIPGRHRPTPLGLHHQQIEQPRAGLHGDGVAGHSNNRAGWAAAFRRGSGGPGANDNHASSGDGGPGHGPGLQAAHLVVIAAAAARQSMRPSSLRRR